MFFLFRKSKLLFTKFDTLHQKSHISGEYTHGLLSFFIPVSFSQFASMYAIPVLAGRNRHVLCLFFNICQIESLSKILV